MPPPPPASLSPSPTTRFERDVEDAGIGFGDADKKTLYIAARTSIYKIRVNVPGMP